MSFMQNRFPARSRKALWAAHMNIHMLGNSHMSCSSLAASSSDSDAADDASSDSLSDADDSTGVKAGGHAGRGGQ